MINVHTLASYLVPAMLSWVPPSEHGKTEDQIRPQYERYSAAIAKVTLETEDRDLPFAGEHRHEMTALLLASIASFEAHLREDVATCAKGGDKDPKGNPRAWGLWQAWRPKERVCASLEAGARIALEMVVDSFKACRYADVRDRLGVYADGPGIVTNGRCRANWWRSRSRIDRAKGWHSKHEIESSELASAAAD